MTLNMQSNTMIRRYQWIYNKIVTTDVDCFDGLVIYFPNDIERERFIFNAEIDRLSRRPL
jgi:hypothetical protein